MVKSWEDFGNGGWVGDHADCSHDLGEVTSRDNGGGLVVDSDLEASGTPVNELDGSLGLDGGNGSIDVLGDNVTSVEHGAGHVLSVSWVALGHHVGWFEWRVGDFSNWELFVIGLFSWDDGGVWGQHEVNSWVGHQVGLEFSDVDVQGTVESQRGSQRGNDLGNQSVEVGVGGSFNVQVSSADVVDGFVVQHHADISVLQQRMGGEDWVVGLNNGGWDLRGRIDSESEFGFLAVVNWQSFQ